MSEFNELPVVDRIMVLNDIEHRLSVAHCGHSFLPWAIVSASNYNVGKELRLAITEVTATENVSFERAHEGKRKLIVKIYLKNTPSMSCELDVRILRYRNDGVGENPCAASRMIADMALLYVLPPTAEYVTVGVSVIVDGQISDFTYQSVNGKEIEVFNQDLFTLNPNAPIIP